MIKAVVFDLDGVLRIGSKAVPGANETIQYLSKMGIRHMICTNECRYLPSELLHLLRGIGVNVPNSTLIYTAGQATYDFFHNKQLKGEQFSIGIVGEDGLHKMLRDFNVLEEPLTGRQYIVIGTVNTIQMSALEKIRRWIHAGALVVATCCDLSDPSLISMGMPNHLLQLALPLTSPEPYSTGKPNPLWARTIMKHFSRDVPDIQPQQVMFVGDTLYTDIKLAEESGFRSVLVLTGNTTRELLQDSTIVPSIVIDSVSDVISLISLLVEAEPRGINATLLYNKRN